MKEIALTQSFVAMVDDEDFERVNALKWHYNQGRAVHTIWLHGRPAVMLLHRFVLGLDFGDPSIDHLNGDPLDNRRANLRLATKAENMRNRGRTSGNSTGWKGVTWDNARNKYKAQIKVDYRNVNLGRFDDPRQAAKAYNAAAIQHFGEFALLNEVAA